ncbi:MAG: hypothetical protein LBQ12_01005 [Deltaproteobacteria bacterium]|jgi:urea transporter|nr:hypothetical protein [Deltaproteobacteria bacterium]
MDPAYQLILVGLGIAAFCTPLIIIKWTVLVPRIRKREKELQDAARTGAEQ